jgi:SAM-dependent methyltransferase
MPPSSARDRFLTLLGDAVRAGTLQKLTLGKHRGDDATLQNLFVRPVTLKSGPQFAFVWRHATRDITKNHTPEAALTLLTPLIGTDFLDAHLFTSMQTAQFTTSATGDARLRVHAATPGEAGATANPAHDRVKSRPIAPHSPWLRDLGVTNDHGEPRERMADKYRQIQKFAELLDHLITEAFPAGADNAKKVLDLADMGSGKGYLTFALAAVLGDRAHVRGVESRPELVDLCNRIARDNGLAERLRFSCGTIASVPLEACDVLIALHACDTATDDALAQGIAAGARLLVVAPCCQKELRPQLTAPPVLAGPLQHGIFQERQAEFVTDALRAQLLEWAGYRTKVFEFVSTEHTAKNLMIAAIKTRPSGTTADATAERVRSLAAFYGIRRQRLAAQLQFSLTP